MLPTSSPPQDSAHHAGMVNGSQSGSNAAASDGTAHAVPAEISPTEIGPLLARLQANVGSVL
ncbi:MAG TPA: hypothetical protein VH120_13000, partial [Gemmataceae bacterium]|nr:hypothetical protein [Gemmataceae bacterium]